jgi:thiosulfate dehydrogenase
MLKDAPFTAEDIEGRAIYAYLESISGEGTSADPVPFTVVGPVIDLPAGDPARGAAVFDGACASCHGAAHSGEGRLVARAPILPEQTITEHPPDKYTPLERRLVFVEKTRHGGFLGYGGQMPPFSVEKLPDADLADLLAFFGVY